MRLAILVAVGLGACRGAQCEQELATGGGGVGSVDVFEAYQPADCVPDEQAFTDVIAPIVEESCGACHGAEPAFGAPMPLVAYDALIAGDPGNRPADRMARRVALHTMPPPSSPQLDHDDLDSLVAWATCGEVHPDPTIGLEVDREPYAADVPENLALPSFDVVATAFPVGRDTLNRYQCFAVDVPIEEPRFLRRMSVVIDDARVLHHVVVSLDERRATEGLDSFLCDDGPDSSMDPIWAWAPGTQAFDFEVGGLELEPGDRVVVEIHYNNGAGLEGVVDSSGVRLFHGPVDGPEWELATTGPAKFKVPEGDSAVCDETPIGGPLRVLAALPHMHQLGAEFQSWVERAEGEDDGVVNLTGWNFEAQLFYALDMELHEGDVLHNRCGFRNETGAPAKAGLRTEDEMCFNFLYVTPND